MERWSNRTVLITGASSGIGAALAKSLVKHGMKVAACARNIKALQDMKAELSFEKGILLPIQCDLRNKLAIDAMFQIIQEEFGGVDVCINNAGLGYNAPLLSGETEEWRELLEVNVLALAICTREAIKSMRKHSVNDGHIIHISSLSGHRVETPGTCHFYAGTKHAVRAMAEGLRRELRSIHSNIRITTISPGDVQTDFASKMYANDKEKMKEPQYEELTCADVVNSVIFAMSAPPQCQVFDILLRPLCQPE